MPTAARALSPLLWCLCTSLAMAQPAPLGGWPQHARARPMAPVVTPGPYAYQGPPSDAVVRVEKNGQLLSPADETVQYRSPQGAQYRSLGENDAIRQARTALGGDYANTAAVIALGVAQSGQRKFREAIETLTRGLEGLQQRTREQRVLQQREVQLRVEEAMLLRWRGHRYLSVREFAKANADLLRGLALDSTNYGILFHLGVLRFAQGRHAEAADYFRRAQPVAPDGGERAASTDWLWMALMRSGRASEAAAMLAERIDQRPDPKPAPPGYAYLSRLKLYRGELSPDSLISPADTDPTSRATLYYGLGNWYLVRGDSTRARAAFRAAVQSGGWAGFGFIVAERELMR